MVSGQKKAIESLFKGVCSIVEYVSSIDSTNKRTKLSETTVLTNQPCRLSFKTISSTNQTDTVASLNQSIKLFISNEVQIKPGSKIIVTQNGVTTAYKNSGEPAIYANHQEIPLELFKERA